MNLSRLILALLFCGACFATQAQATKTAPKKTTTKKVVKKKTPKKASKVFICDGGVNTYTYHIRRSCSNMKKCTNKILDVSMHDATGTFNRKPCKICAK